VTRSPQWAGADRAVEPDRGGGGRPGLVTLRLRLERHHRDVLVAVVMGEPRLHPHTPCAARRSPPVQERRIASAGSRKRPPLARSDQTPKGIAVDVRSGGHPYPSPPAKISCPVRLGYAPVTITRWCEVLIPPRT